MSAVATIPGIDGADPTYLFQAEIFNAAANALDMVAAKGFGFWNLSFKPDGSIQDINCSPSAEYSMIGPVGAASEFR